MTIDKLINFDLKLILNSIILYAEDFLSNHATPQKPSIVTRLFYRNDTESILNNSLYQHYQFCLEAKNIIYKTKDFIKSAEQCLHLLETEEKNNQNPVFTQQYKKFISKLQRILPIKIPHSSTPTLQISNTLSKKNIHYLYTRMIYLSENNQFNAELLNCFLTISQSLYDECDKHQIPHLFNNEIKYLFKQLYIKNIKFELRNLSNFNIFFVNTSIQLQQTENLFANANTIINSFIHVYQDEFISKKNLLPANLHFDQQQAEAVIQTYFVLNPINPTQIIPNYNINPNLLIYDVKHNLRINKKFLMNLFNTMSCNIESTKKDLHRCDYYFNETKIQFSLPAENINHEEINFNYFNSLFVKNNIHPKLILFLQQCSHQGALIGLSSIWFMEYYSSPSYSLISENKRFYKQDNNILTVEVKDSNHLKINSIAIFKISQIYGDEDICSMANDKGFVLSFEIKLSEERNSLQIKNSTLMIANFSEMNLFNKILYKEIKKGIEFFSIKNQNNPDNSFSFEVLQ